MHLQTDNKKAIIINLAKKYNIKLDLIFLIEYMTEEMIVGYVMELFNSMKNLGAEEINRKYNISITESIKESIKEEIYRNFIL